MLLKFSQGEKRSYYHKMFPRGHGITHDLKRVGDPHKFTSVSVLNGLLHNRRKIGQEIRAQNAE